MTFPILIRNVGGESRTYRVASSDVGTRSFDDDSAYILVLLFRSRVGIPIDTPHRLSLRRPFDLSTLRQAQGTGSASATPPQGGSDADVLPVVSGSVPSVQISSDTAGVLPSRFRQEYTEAGRQECLPHPYAGFLSMAALAQQSCTHCQGNSTAEVLLLSLLRQRVPEAGRQECLPHPQRGYRVYIPYINKNGHSNMNVKWPLSAQQKVDLYGAGNGTRTRDFKLGKLALYQLSYSRPCCW